MFCSDEDQSFVRVAGSQNLGQLVLLVSFGNLYKKIKILFSKKPYVDIKTTPHLMKSLPDIWKIRKIIQF